MNFHYTKLFSILSSTLILSACFSGGSGGDNSNSHNQPTSYTVSDTISSSLSENIDVKMEVSLIPDNLSIGLNSQYDHAVSLNDENTSNRIVCNPLSQPISVGETTTFSCHTPNKSGRHIIDVLIDGVIKKKETVTIIDQTPWKPLKPAHKPWTPLKPAHKPWVPISPPTKIVEIYNSFSNTTIYPVIATPTNDADEWLQAYFKVNNPKTSNKTYAHKFVYRVYLNGIPPGQSIKIRIPFYSALTNEDNQANTVDKYIDWWNGARVKLYDVQPHPNQDPTIHENPITPKSQSLCVLSQDGSNCLTSQVWKSKAALRDNNREQLLEFSLADAITSQNPYQLFYGNVDYDISYVDHVYLPVAMEPLNNPYIGYIGTIKNDFDQAITNFLKSSSIGEGWPHFLLPTPGQRLKLPGTYNALALNTHQEDPNGVLSPKGASIQNIYKLWALCVPSGHFNTLLPDHKQPTGQCPYPNIDGKNNLQRVYDFFKANYTQYKNNALCTMKNGQHRITDTPHIMLERIYGFVPFNDDCKTPNGQKDVGANALCKTPSAEDPDPSNPVKCTKTYFDTHNKYVALEYSKAGNMMFNPYVHLIHDQEYLGMNAYSFSIDDASGNMQELGDGIIISVGGSLGLVNKFPYNKHQAINVSGGTPYQKYPWITPKDKNKVVPGATWDAYGACSTEPLPGKTCPTNRMMKFLSPIHAGAKFGPFPELPSKQRPEWVTITDAYKTIDNDTSTIHHRIYKFKVLTMPVCSNTDQSDCEIKKEDIESFSCSTDQGKACSSDFKQFMLLQTHYDPNGKVNYVNLSSPLCPQGYHIQRMQHGFNNKGQKMYYNVCYLGKPTPPPTPTDFYINTGGGWNTKGFVCDLSKSINIKQNSPIPVHFNGKAPCDVKIINPSLSFTLNKTNNKDKLLTLTNCSGSLCKNINIDKKTVILPSI
ncbi:hypothetical protein L3V83_12925 [Thiotrichales bacterium 19X7-9]|nr:hypothetical protein [Thiotrichales bacterium 19X7-9]